MGSHSYRRTAYCIWSVISTPSHLNRGCTSLGLTWRVPAEKETTEIEIGVWHEMTLHMQ